MEPITTTRPPAPDALSLHLAAIATHLDLHHETLLHAWRQAVEADERLRAASRLNRQEFADNIPASLRVLSNRLRLEIAPIKPPSAAPSSAESPGNWAQQQEEVHASEHGLHRWQEGYDISELMWEWGHLHLCLLRFLEELENQLGPASHAAFARARYLLAELINSGFSQSVTAYHQLQQAEAKEIVRDLSQSLEQLEAANRQRGEYLRQAVHDLRGNVFPLTSAAELLETLFQSEPGDEYRNRVLQLLHSSTRSHAEMLNDLLDLARLEAGQESMQLEGLDASALLVELARSLEPMAQKKELQLQWTGPANLHVTSDPLKVRRIVQNLLLNALKYTKQGKVQVTWGNAERDQWFVEVQDTGPGIQTGIPANAVPHFEPPAQSSPEQLPLAQALLDASAHPITLQLPQTPPTPSTAQNQRGEGVGLVIVKRLCTLLHAKLEMHSTTQGTVFRVTLPSCYF